MKACNVCGKIKSESDFYSAKGCKGNIRPECKLCFSSARKTYRENNSETVKENKRREYQKHSDTYIQRAANYRKENPEKRLKWDADYRIKHAEQEKARHKKYDSEHPEQVKARYINYRTKKHAGGRVTASEWKEVLKRYGYKCLGCGNIGVTLEMDHIIPISKGGLNTVENIQPLCRSCNARKSAKTIDYRNVEIRT